MLGGGDVAPWLAGEEREEEAEAGIAALFFPFSFFPFLFFLPLLVSSYTRKCG